MLVTIIEHTVPNAYEERKDVKDALRTIAHTLTTSDDDEIIEVCFARLNEKLYPVLTVAFFAGWDQAHNNGQPLYHHSVCNNETVSEGYLNDSELLKKLFKCSLKSVVNEVTSQLIEAHNPEYPKDIWFNHSEFGRSCFYQELCELTIK